VSTAGIGVDVVDVARFSLALERHPRLLTRLFTDGECEDAAMRAERLAARFAAKEAVLKALGVGIGVTSWRSIEVTRGDDGAPSVTLHGAALRLAQGRGITGLHLSLSHTATTAVAFCVADGRGDADGR